MVSSIQLKRVTKTFISPAGTFCAVANLEVGIAKGQFVGILGHSGSGKSTLLNLVCGIEMPTSGSVTIGEREISRLTERELTQFRGEQVGIVFQFFQLVPTLTVVENVVLAMDLVGKLPRKIRKHRAMDLLDQMGVASHSRKFPAHLSGGEQQRVAIARSLANDPSILIADEPTGNLDEENSRMVRALFSNCAKEGRTVLVATHEVDAAGEFDRILKLADGRLVEDSHE